MSGIATDNLQKEIRSLVAEILEIKEENITPEARFVEELGMDSMMALEILASVEKKYKIKIPEKHLADVVNLKSMADIARNILENR
jgi:acyl carrier protein